MPNSTDESDIDQLIEEEPGLSEVGPEPKSRWVKWIKRLTVASLVMLGLIAVATYFLLELAKHEPEFYQQVLRVDPQQQKRNGSEMERKILDLRNSVMIADAWSATFSQDQINGW